MPLYFEPADMPEPMSIVAFVRRDEAGELQRLQSFTLLRHEPYTTDDGRRSAIMTWRSDCMDCGQGFNFTSGLTTGAFYRRCKKCRRGKQPTGWPKGPRIRHVLERYDDVNPASLF